MRGKKVKELRKLLRNENSLIALRNILGEKTKEMNQMQLYQNFKRVYKQKSNLVPKRLKKGE